MSFGEIDGLLHTVREDMAGDLGRKVCQLKIKIPCFA